MKDIKGYEGIYAITEDGRVWSYRRKIFLKQRLDKYGYPRITLYFDGKLKTYFIHRLVAEAYLPNPEEKTTVNHLDECKTNNHISNLAWATVKENNQYGTRSERAAKSKQKPVRCVETGEIFESIKAAAAAYNVHPSCISSCIAGKQQTSGKCHWEYYYGEEE